jgi:hypothetical protein
MKREMEVHRIEEERYTELRKREAEVHRKEEEGNRGT